VKPAIRPARPEDADFIAWTILSAQRGHLSRGWFDIALNWPEPQCAEFVRRITVTRIRSWWHTSQFMIAEVEGMPAAALCALPAGRTLAAARSAIEETAAALSLSAPELSEIWRRGNYSGKCWVQGGDDDWLIEHVASRPSFRGRGLMSALIERALAAGKAAGYARASITFYIGNDAAERCYAKAGFRFAEEKRHPEFEALTGAPGFRRFERAIR
jgi:GNAT superfamily N-acetyltransferase